MRIVSLLPSATEIICALGLRDQLVGISHECDFPMGIRELPKVTQSRIPKDATSGRIDEMVREQSKQHAALYALDLDTLQALQPDLIVTQALCDVCAVDQEEVRLAAEKLAGRPRVIQLEPSCLEDLFADIAVVGEAADCRAKAAAYVGTLRRRVQLVAERSKGIVDRPSVVLLEWIDPPFCAGHWSPELVELAGGSEVIGTAGERSHATSWSEIINADPSVMLIACCGLDADRTMQDIPILKSYAGWNKLRCVLSGRVYVTDGSQYFSRPGPRLVDSLEILAHTLHPGVHPLPANLPPARSV